MAKVPLEKFFTCLIKAEHDLNWQRWLDHKGAHDLLAEAVKGKEQVLREKLDEMNQFRQQIIVERSLFVQREFYEERHNALIDRVAELEKYKSNLDGRFWMLGSVLGGITIVVNVVIYFLGHK